MNAAIAMSDEQRETEITRAALHMADAKSPDVARWYWNQMQQLIAERSSQQVERMEREKGLRT